jgi:MtN3 and saliva related transmembrane protein
VHFFNIPEFTAVDFLGIAAGFLSLLSTIPQIVKSATSRSTKDISLLTLLLGSSGSTLWLLYGFIQLDKALIICNIIGVMLGLVLLKLKLRFG